MAGKLLVYRERAQGAGDVSAGGSRRTSWSCFYPGPAGSWVPAALHQQVSVQKSPAPAVQRDPRAATPGVCQEDDNSSEGN